MSRTSISGTPLSIHSPPIRPTPSGKFPVYAHLDDLVARTRQLAPTDHASIQGWLDVAEKHWHQYRAAMDFGRQGPDQAFVNYLMAYTVVAYMIPKHREYPSFRMQKSSTQYARFNKLQSDLASATEDVNRIKKDIKHNNKLMGTQSVVALLEASESKAPPANHQNGLTNTKPPIARKPTALTSQPLSPPGREKVNGVNGNGVRTSAERSPKVNNKDIDDLWSRLYALKPDDTPKVGTNGVSDGKNGILVSSYVSKGFGKTDDFEPHLPTPPVPAYSIGKAVNPIGVGYISPPGYSTPIIPSALSVETLADGAIDRTESPVAQSQIISADSLYQYMTSLSSKVTILFLDLRNRETYDAGHIAGDSCCVEQFGLSEGISAEEIENLNFELSSDPHEQGRFANRNLYDVVVLYDQSTADPDYMKSKNRDHLTLQHVTNALTVYSYDKKLKGVPYLLLGGFDAWLEKVGRDDRFIRTSNTSSAMQTYATEELDPYKRAELEFPDIDSRIGEDLSPTKSELWVGNFQETTDVATIGRPPDGENGNIRKQRRNMSIVSNPDLRTDLVVNRNIEDYLTKARNGVRERESMVSPRNGFYESPSHSPSVYRNPNFSNPFFGFNDSRHGEVPSSPSRPPPAATRQSYSGVAERIPHSRTDQPVVLTNRDASAGSRRVLFDLPFTDANHSIGQVGLKNLGNTCYMNSIIQCIAGTVPVARYFLDGSYKSHINKQNPLGSRGVLCRAFADLIKDLWRGSSKFVSPITFKDVSGRLNETFASDDQQDALEFLEFFLDGIHEDLNLLATKPKLRELTEDEERVREKMPVQRASLLEWKRYQLRNQSIITDWFQGQLSSRLRCLTCNTTSTTYSPFTYLSLPIPSHKSKVTLKECLDEFLKEETLEQEDAWGCPNCKQPRRATKKLTITRLPNMLIVHFKRFATKDRWQNKLNTPIEFPVADWNLQPLLPPPIPEESLPKGEQGTQQKPPFDYSLYAVCNHYGSLHGGHYTAYVHNSYSRSWSCHDDSRTSHMSEEEVVSREAYLLFYVRLGDTE